VAFPACFNAENRFISAPLNIAGEGERAGDDDALPGRAVKSTRTANPGPEFTAALRS